MSIRVKYFDHRSICSLRLRVSSEQILSVRLVNVEPMTNPSRLLSSQTRYSMGVASRRSGVAAETIRAWERRYGAVVPQRSAGGTRRYSAEDIRRLTLLRELTERGAAISAVASLPDVELEARLAPSELPAAGAVADVETSIRGAYLDAITRMDTRAAADVLMRAGTLLDPRTTVLRVAIPIMQEVGRRWVDGRFGIAQEHLISGHMRSLLSSLLRLGPPSASGERIVFGAPTGHRHEFGLLAGALLAASHRLEPVYLGVDLPLTEISWAARASSASIVVTSLVRDSSDAELSAVSAWAAEVASERELWIGCASGSSIVSATPHATHFHSFDAFDSTVALRIH
jgi:DNA-binding transcriptional MerR regulator